MKNRNIILTAILLTLGSFALPPRTQAVVPAPDGGYPGQNTAEGQSALLHLAGGTYNTALGWASLGFNVTGNFNTAVGAATLLNNTADNNTATGAGALLSNTSGTENTANGAFALLNNSTGGDNTANGYQALLNNSHGSGNTANGYSALVSNTHGSFNTAVGVEALRFNIGGDNNTAVGVDALEFSTGGGNTAVGSEALLALGTGSHNVALGEDALVNNDSGSNNVALGGNAGFNSGSGSNNVALGFNAGSGVTTASNVICIGANVAGNDVNDSCYIGNIFGDTSSNGTAVFVNANGRLGTMTSSQRFKEEIKPMEKASEALLALKPVTFRYKKEIDPAGTSQFGLVAEEVEKVNRDLVVHDKEGRPYSVRYEQVNAMLLNEFLKEHSKVEKLEAALDTVKKRLNEQEARIQKVSAEVEVSEPAAKTALNSQ